MWFDFFWMEGERERCMCERQGERWEEVFMGSVLLPARQDKESLVKLSKSPDAEICEKPAHIVLILFLLGTDGCEAVCAQL